jgi:hypothetical protein
MKKAKIRIYPRLKCDTNSAKLMQKMVDDRYEKYEGVISAVVAARAYLLEAFPQTAYMGDSIWNRILAEVVQMDIKNLTQKEEE